MGAWETIKGYGEKAANIGTLGAYGALKSGLSSPDTTGIEEQQRRAQDFQTRLEAELGAAGAATAPTITAANVNATGGRVATTMLSPAERIQAAQMADAPQVTAPKMGDVERVAERTVGAVTTKAAQIDPVERAAAERAAVERAQDTSGIGARQLSLISNLEARARGEGGPSVAEQQLRMGLEAAQKQALSLAAGARGQNRGSALRAGLNKAGDLSLQGNQQLALLRAQEQQQATGQLSEAMQGARGQELQLALANAAAGNQVALANAGRGTDVNLANAGAANTRSTNQAQLTQQATQNDAGRAQDAATTTAQLGQQAALANAGAANSRTEKQAGLDVEVATGNANRTQDTNKTNAGLTQDANKSNQDAGNQRNLAQGQLVQDAGKTNAGLAQERNITGAKLAQDAATANQGAAVTTAGQNIQQRAGIRQDIGQAQSTAMQGATGILNAEEQGKSRRTQLVGGLLGAAGQAAVAKSDRRDKADIVDLLSREARGGGEDDALRAFLEDLHPYAYRYRDPASDGAGPRVGVMAQDLEKNPVGRTVVREDGNGKKMIDTAAAVGVTLAALAKMREEMDNLKRRSK